MRLNLPDSGAEPAPDSRRYPPSAQRNAALILTALQDHAPASGSMLELAAGSGLHTARLATALPGLDWQPTDVDPANFASILAWSAACPRTIRPPVLLDASQPGWSAQWPNRDAILMVNLLHLIAEPAAATLLAEIALALSPTGTAFLYGPFLREGQPSSEGDAAFDASLRAQDPQIGYKDLDWVLSQLRRSGLNAQCLEMPANNLMIVTRRT
jgi:hypothetical protein